MRPESGSRPTIIDTAAYSEVIRPVGHALEKRPAYYRAEENTPNEDNGYAHLNGLGIFDGVGGSAHGEIASELTRNAFYTQTSPLSFENTTAHVEAALHTGWNNAVIGVRDYLDQQDLEGPAETTATVVQVFREESRTRVSILQSGDSRASALMANGTLLPLTRDHSMVWEDARDGSITQEDATEIAHIIDTYKSPEDIAKYTGKSDIKKYIKERNIVAKNLSSTGPLDPEEDHPHGYTLETFDLPEGTIAIIGQSDGIHDVITPTDEAAQFKGARSTQDAAKRVLKFVDKEVENALDDQPEDRDEAKQFWENTRVKGDDAIIGILQFRPFPRGDMKSFFPDKLPTAKQTGIAAMTTAALVTIWALTQSGGEQPAPPPAKTEDTRPTATAKPTLVVELPKPTLKPVATEQARQNTTDVYASLPLARYYPGKVRVNIGEDGANVRYAPTTNPTRVDNWILSRDKIKAINGVPIDTEKGTDTFAIANAPITYDRDPNNPGNWLVVMATVDMATEPGTTRIEQHDVYVFVGEATAGAVDPLDEHDQPIEDTSSLTLRGIKTENGKRFDENGKPLTLGQIQTFSR